MNTKGMTRIPIISVYSCAFVVKYSESKLMKLTRFPLTVVICSIAISLAGCGKKAGPVHADHGLTKVRFQTDWYPQPEHGGYYQALAKGFYKEEGLEVEILPGGPNAQVKQQVAMGQADLGMTNGDDVIVAIARGLPIQM